MVTLLLCGAALAQNVEEVTAAVQSGDLGTALAALATALVTALVTALGTVGQQTGNIKERLSAVELTQAKASDPEKAELLAQIKELQGDQHQQQLEAIQARVTALESQQATLVDVQQTVAGYAEHLSALADEIRQRKT